MKSIDTSGRIFFIILTLFCLQTLSSENIFNPDGSWNLKEFTANLDSYLDDASRDDLERLRILYNLLEQIGSWRINRTIESYYHDGDGERPSSSNLDRNLRYTLFLEQIYIRIDSVKIRTAEALGDALKPVPGLSRAINNNIDTMAMLNSDMRDAVETARQSFEEMILIRNDYLEVIDLQRDILRASLEMRGPEAVLLVGTGFSRINEGRTSITAEAGLLYNLGLFDFGIKAFTDVSMEVFGAGLLFGLNIK